MTTSDNDKPPRVQPRLKHGPKVRDLYWCDFPQDAQLPEFWKRRPVLVLATDRALSGAVTVIPCSSQLQEGNKWAFKLNQTIDGNPSWAICDKITSVAVSRLSLHRDKKRRVPQEDLSAVLGIVLQWLPKVPTAPEPDAQSTHVEVSSMQ